MLLAWYTATAYALVCYIMLAHYQTDVIISYLLLCNLDSCSYLVVDPFWVKRLRDFKSCDLLKDSVNFINDENGLKW